MNASPVSCLATLSEERREEFWASLALRYTAGIGFRTAKRLLVEFGSASAALKDIKNWSSRASISAKVVEAVLSNRWREQARKEWDNAGQVACEVLLWSDSDYPELLREIPDPPLFLYYKGDASLLKNPAIGVVGSRRCSNDGIRTTEMLSKTLSASGVTTVSGLARGIDSVAHANALSGWGSTVAVLGTGISHVYPPENKDLFFDVAEQGIIVTEFPPNMPPEGRNFPLRNRIISGLSLGVLVVEALSKSGSLITARHALEQGREVFAVPGRMQSRTSSGCHELIRQGATAVFSCDDILVSIAPLLGISLDNFTRTGDIASVSSSVQPSAASPLPDFPEFKEDVNVAEVGAASELTAIDTESGISASGQSASEQAVPDMDSQEPIMNESVDVDISTVEWDVADCTNPESNQELSIEEQLRSIPEVIEIPLSSPAESVAFVADGISADEATSLESKSTEVEPDLSADEGVELPKAKLLVHADILPLEEKVIDLDAPLEDQIILLLTGEESVHIDVLSRMLFVPASKISTALLMLEVSGLVQQLPGMKYKKV
ncbi:DNA-processing protein DprA [Halodesulfovibrio marinisediminis]|uniref:DNA recombination-mediator protein A n=1 Tax=Halodesulfovibrio marinisediminis DSM 17456 TaxID=1121457 RepID=A0A1N6I6N9_9BACT|nr:DNA-processing protein DprA [Halodesulfovibrio marinisediminis]SIO27663.1 DNA recombination-mediator protein A [Halodesulfovibrio marinisediminis DSM 17456]